MTDNNVFQLCSKILRKLGFENESLLTLVDKWKAFVKECNEGYRWDYSEYLNEIRARTLIQQLLNDQRIAKFDQFQDLFSEVYEADNVFKSLLKSDDLLDEGEYWWESGVLKKAGDEYCQYMHDAHQIRVENLDI